MASNSNDIQLNFTINISGINLSEHGLEEIRRNAERSLQEYLDGYLGSGTQYPLTLRGECRDCGWLDLGSLSDLERCGYCIQQGAHIVLYLARQCKHWVYRQ